MPGGERKMMEFETITLAPIDLELVEPTLLTADERAWLNAYHARVRETLTPLVDDETRRLAGTGDAGDLTCARITPRRAEQFTGLASTASCSTAICWAIRACGRSTFMCPHGHFGSGCRCWSILSALPPAVPFTPTGRISAKTCPSALTG